ncbi:MAG: GNAT family N-acetyltransferase [Anaerolineae bacterium]|nr:GNAT family N-acetyltransferase [Anaerolineae bacterium]
MSQSYFFAPERWATSRFIVRCYRPGDGPLLADAVNTSYEHLKSFMVWAQPHTSLEDAEQLVRRWRARYLMNSEFVLGIFSSDERRLLGSSGFHLREEGLENRAAEIGMWIRADAAGQGLGTAVLQAMLHWGFTVWPWERLVWRCNCRNDASRRTAEKGGMMLEGTFRAYERRSDGKRDDFFYFSALREEWHMANDE